MAISSMSAQVLRRALDARKLACSNLTNLARSTFKSGVKIMYRVMIRGGASDMIGEVVSVYPEGYDVMIEVKSPNGKARKIRIDQIIGLMEGVYASE